MALMLRAFGFAIFLAACALPAQAQQQRPSRVQIFSESFSMAAKGPYFVRLDSGVTYRLVAEGTSAGDVMITPRSVSGAPIRFSSSSITGNGTPFTAPGSAQYRVESTYQGNDIVQVRIFRELRDASECADPTRPGCVLAVSLDAPGHRRISPAVIVMMGLFPLFLLGVFRNGKNL